MTTYTTTVKQGLRSESRATTDAVRPMLWLREGWNDLVSAPLISGLVGGGFTLLCAAAYAAASTQPLFSASILTLLLIVSPFIAVTAYYVSRQREQNQTPSLRVCFRDIRSNALSIGLFSMLSALIVAAWVRLSSLAFALYYGTLDSGAAEVARTWTAGSDFPAMPIFLASMGVVLALTMFVVGAIALPLIADRNQNVVTAVTNSIEVLKNNVTTMMVWMLLLIALITVALLSGLLLMPVVFPLLAYATWHSYRQLMSNN